MYSADEVRGVLKEFRALDTVLQKYDFLIRCRRNRGGLFWACVEKHPDELLPVLYTPGVGEACLKWGYLQTKPQAIRLTPEDKGQFLAKIKSWPTAGTIDIVVVTDGQRILGLGDLGANGVGISVGKSVLYTLAGGIHPARVLPVVLDVGCDNEEFRESEAYWAPRRPRLKGPEYENLVDEFYRACQTAFKEDVLIHWEDFGASNAASILAKYRGRGPTFNDDIQSTAAVVLASLLGASKRATVPSLTEQQYVLLGAGQAGLGIARLIMTTLVKKGLSETDALSRIWVLDSSGLIGEGRDNLSDQKQEYAKTAEDMRSKGLKAGSSLLETVKRAKATCIIGSAGKGGLFTDQVLKTLSAGMPIIEDPEGGSLRATPIVMPLSNPTDNSECSFQDAWDATKGNVAFASGSPFPPVETGEGPVSASQANNAMIFPGLGVGTVLTGASSIPDDFFVAAAEALAGELSPQESAAGLVIPPVTRIRDAALAVAIAVAVQSSVKMVTTNAGDSEITRAASDVASALTNGSAQDVKTKRQRLRQRILDWKF